MSPKPAKKVKPSKPRAKPRASLVPQPHGGALLPGGTGAGGRPPDAWKALCREMASSDEMVAKLREVLKDKDHPAWLGAYRFLEERGFGKQKDENSINLPAGSKGVLVWRFGDREIEF